MNNYYVFGKTLQGSVYTIQKELEYCNELRDELKTRNAADEKDFYTEFRTRD